MERRYCLIWFTLCWDDSSLFYDDSSLFNDDTLQCYDGTSLCYMYDNTSLCYECRGGVVVERSPRMREIRVRSLVRTDLSL